MDILDRYWTNYESPSTVDRQSLPPMLNFGLVKRINGRSGSLPQPFDWKGEIRDIEKELKNPENFEIFLSMEDDEIHASAGSLAQIYHKFTECKRDIQYKCTVNVFGKTIQVLNCPTEKKRGPDNSNEETERILDISQKCGVAIGYLFTMEDEVTEETNALRSKLAYFATFQRRMPLMNAQLEYTRCLLKIRKEIDIMLKENDEYIPVELKTRSSFGMNKYEFCSLFLPSLMTRCYLTGMFSILIAVREDKAGTKIIRVQFFEDIRKISSNDCYDREEYFTFFFKKLIEVHNDLTAIDYGIQGLTLMSRDKAIIGCENLDTHRRPWPSRHSYERRSFLQFIFFIGEDFIKQNKPDIIITDEEMFVELTPSTFDLAKLMKLKADETNWALRTRNQDLILIAWTMESLIDILTKCDAYTERQEPFHYNFYVFLPTSENTPKEDVVTSNTKLYLGNGTWINTLDQIKVHFYPFKDITDLEDKLTELSIYQTAKQTMVLIGASAYLPEQFAVDKVDLFLLNTFPRKDLLDMIFLPEKIAVFGNIEECLEAKDKLSSLEMFEGFADYTYFFVINRRGIPDTDPLKHYYAYPISRETDFLPLFIELGLPYVLF